MKATSIGKKTFSYDMKILWNLILVILGNAGYTWGVGLVGRIEQNMGIIICEDRKLSTFRQKHGPTYGGQMESNKTSPLSLGGMRIIRITFIWKDTRRTHLRKEL